MVPWSCKEQHHHTQNPSPKKGNKNHTYCPTYQAFDHFEQLLHHHGDALITQQSTHDLDVWRTQEVPVRAVYTAVRQVQGLHSEAKQK